MQFKQFLLEQDLTDGAADLIKHKCQPFLEMSEGKPLFRAVTRPIESISVIPHPKSRPPRDSGPEFSFTFNSCIDAAFNIADIRQRSFFAVGSVTEASKYATNLAFCFPCGDFKYIWSEEIQDSYVGDDGGLGFLADYVCANLPKKYFKITPEIIVEFFENLFSIISKGGSSTWVHNLDGLAETYTEQAARACSNRSILKLKHNDLVAVMKKFGTEMYTDGNLPQAIKSHNEIFFYESGGYILVPFSAIVKSGTPYSTAYQGFLKQLS